MDEELEIIQRMAGLRCCPEPVIHDIRRKVWQKIDLLNQTPEPVRYLLPVAIMCATSAAAALMFGIIEISRIADESMWHPHLLSFMAH